MPKTQNIKDEMEKLYAIVARLRPSPWPWRGPNQAKVTRADSNHCLVTTLKYPPAYSTGSRYWRPSPILITKRHWVMSLCLLPYKVTWYQSHKLFDPVPVFELSPLWSDYHPPSRLFPHCHHPPSEFLAKEKPASVSPSLLPCCQCPPCCCSNEQGDTLLMAHTRRALLEPIARCGNQTKAWHLLFVS